MAVIGPSAPALAGDEDGPLAATGVAYIGGAVATVFFGAADLAFAVKGDGIPTEYAATEIVAGAVVVGGATAVIAWWFQAFHSDTNASVVSTTIGYHLPVLAVGSLMIAHGAFANRDTRPAAFVAPQLTIDHGRASPGLALAMRW